ncbi:hypothetical protein CLV30_11931 [Haloactinopolyspora alba]|uniref:Uncharacterized protein n=1 Tax=Haloactinopolyspora alba TaxID=648780 RepID=A0A2P8DN72_9ACTN|nr:hypothetical protein [Haloactinopolyspora alba]PSK98649.1 hypothetical protein CLV30_11931 [Haloactinopolyspora alba]
MVTLPRSARLAAWATAWLRGAAALDDVTTRTCADDEPHDVSDIPGTIGTVSLAEALPALRDAGATAFRVALPVPGDPRGLGGPAELNGDAVDVGEVVLTDGAPYALLPDIQVFGPPGDQGHLVTWTCRNAEPAPPGDSLAEADQALSAALLEAGSELTALDVPAWRPEVAALLEDVRESRVAEPLPRGFPSQAQTVAARAARLRSIVGFALTDDGGAVSASSAESRRAALTPLEQAARHALVAACNSLADTP